jgi:hypothetical protein
MARDLSNNYKLYKITEQTISKDNFIEIFHAAGTGLLDCIVFTVNDTDMDLSIEIDGVAIVDSFRLKDFSSIYGLSNNSDFDLPLTSIDSKTFRFRLKNYIQFQSTLSIKLKHASKNNKEVRAGYVTYKTR